MLQPLDLALHVRDLSGLGPRLRGSGTFHNASDRKDSANVVNDGAVTLALFALGFSLAMSMVLPPGVLTGDPNSRPKEAASNTELPLYLDFRSLITNPVDRRRQERNNHFHGQ